MAVSPQRAKLEQVDVQALDPARLEPLIGPERMANFEQAAEVTQSALAGRVILNVNSTAVGGGVAEMLQTLLAYVRGVGVDARWLVIQGDPEFFALTKRIHNGLYGGAGDGGLLDAAGRRHYEDVLQRNADELLALVRPRDVVVLHDPQTAGLAPLLRGAGALILWRCHVGTDTPNEWTERAWDFLRPYLEEVDAFIFTRASFAPAWAPPERTAVIPPSIDPFSAKNEPMTARNVRLALGYVGLLEGDDGTPPVVPFARRDGSPGRINRKVDILQTGPPAPADAPLVMQVSRWDGMKDMAGVMEGFAHHVDPSLGAHLVLCGPAVAGVADDPEAAVVLEDCMGRWRSLPDALRSRVHLASVPMDDADEAAAIINALQRHATVAVQKSISEGFGLTVAEAMWKSRPIVASAVGGIVDQITDCEHGLLIDDPNDLPAFGAAVERLLREPDEARAFGRAARVRAATEFLGDRHLKQYASIVERLT